MAFTITKADISGFFVQEVVPKDMYNPIIFAGSLTECLKFVENALALAPAVEGGAFGRLAR